MQNWNEIAYLIPELASETDRITFRNSVYPRFGTCSFWRRFLDQLPCLFATVMPFDDSKSIDNNVDLEQNGSESDVTSQESVGIQIAREREHAIKYRTCSWQKVRCLLPWEDLTWCPLIDSSLVILGVHLSGNIIFSLVRFCVSFVDFNPEPTLYNRSFSVLGLGMFP